MATYAISDIHGNNEKFRRLLDELSFGSSDKLFLLGDFIDRGPQSKEVLDTIMDLINKGYDVTCLRGNHEQMLLDAFHSEAHLNFWLRNGGQQTMESFGSSHIVDIPELYLNFFQELPYYVEYRNFILVHAGINMLSESPLEDFEAMLWLRGWEKKFNRTWIGDRIVIHGHTPMERSRINSRANKNRIVCIDNGSYFINNEEFGKLAALQLDTMEFYFV